MPRRKRTSKVLGKADRRSSALKSIDKMLGLGNGLTLEKFNSTVENLRSSVDQYNSALSEIDAIYNNIMANEKDVNELSELMLLGVASKYGKNSNEYEMAGGIRKMDRKRPSRSVSSLSTRSASQSLAS